MASIPLDRQVLGGDSRARIHRTQKVTPIDRQVLHFDRGSRFKGLGDDSTGIDLTDLPVPTGPDLSSSLDISSGLDLSNLPFPTGGSLLSPNLSPSSSINWNQILGTAISGSTKIFQELALPQGELIQTGPSGSTVYRAPTGSSALSVAGLGFGTTNSIMPFLLLGGAALLVVLIMVAGKR